MFPAPSGLGLTAPKLPRVLVWFRRDLRLIDNPALAAALDVAEEVIPIYIYAPEEEGQFQPGRCSRWWLSSSLDSLDADLQALGSRLLRFRAAESRVALSALVRDLGAQGVFFNHLYDPISMVRDNEVKATLGAAGIACRSFTGDVLREPWEVLDPTGAPFSCFDSFWAAHCAVLVPPPPPLAAPTALPPISPSLDAFGRSNLEIMTPEEALSNSQLEYHWTPGCAGGHRLLREFVDGGRLARFSADRAKTDRASTSRLSPHIHFGEVSAREVHAAAIAKRPEFLSVNAESSIDDFLRQLGYREYSRYLSFHFPFTHERSLLEHLRAVPWRFDQALFKAWRTGTTGYPLVDAGMREVWSTGWMHNRIRVVAASFMVKILLLPWQWGLKHYWDALLDADLECDALGWQYCAGCLADAHPLEFVMDLESEAKRFDPDGNYVRRWLPVLARLPAAYIHAPWEAPAQVLADAGVELGVNYPWPVVDMEDSKSALASVVKIVEEAKETGSGGVGSGGGGGAIATAGAPMNGTGLVSTAVAVTDNAGPFRPATRPDPGAAMRVWGPGGGRLVGGSVAWGGGRSGVPGRTAPSAKSGDESVDEEVESNVVGGAGGAGSSAGAAASAPLHHHQHNAQSVWQGSRVAGMGVSQPLRQPQVVTDAVTARTGSSMPMLAPPVRAPGAARPPLPPSALPPAPAAAVPRAVVQMETAGAPRSAGGASGGSNRASHTVAVVPTVSEAGAAAVVPDTSAPMDADNDCGRKHSLDALAAAEPAPMNGAMNGASGDDIELLDASPRAYDQHTALFGCAEGTVGAPAPAPAAPSASEDEPVWPPETKRQRHGSS